MNKIWLESGRLVVSTRYNPEWIDLFRSIPQSVWNPSTKTWSFPHDPKTLLILKSTIMPVELSPELSVADPNELRWKREELEREYQDVVKNETRYESKTDPFKHQLVAWDFVKDKKAAALLMEMGTGKTKVVIDVVNYIYNHKELMKNMKILVVSPSSVIYNEVDEFNAHSKIQFRLFPCVGTKKQRENIFAEASREKDFPCVVFINYEALATFEDLITLYNPAIIILDESTRIKNHTAQCSKVCHRIGRSAKYRYIMTGTPVTQNLMDVYSQYKFLDPTILGASFVVFKAKYAIMGGFENREVVGYRNVEELKEKVFSVGIRFTKDECLDLPEKIYETEYYELSPEQKRIYNEMKENLITEFEKGEICTAKAAIVKLLRLRQICSGIVPVGEYDDAKLRTLDPNPKLKLLEEFIDEHENEKVVIWCEFIQEIKDIQNQLERRGKKVFTLYGETPIDERVEKIAAFNQSKEADVFIGQIQTGGIGINLTSANQVVYYSNSYSLSDRLQSEDRTHRIGQKNNVIYTDFVGKGTIEESVIKILKKKKDVAGVLSAGNLKQLLEGEL